MKKHKTYYWLGLGSGLIVGAILIQLMTFTSDPISIDLSDLEEAAVRHGYRLVNEQEVIRIIDGEVVHAIYILPEMTLEQIAELLASARLIDEPATFLHAIERISEPVHILPGYYEVTGSPSIGDLVDILMSP